MAKLRDIVKNQNYPIIEIREKVTDSKGKVLDLFTGYCSYVRGKLTALDGGSYSLDDEYETSAEWEDDEEGTCLSVWIKSES